MQMKIIKYCGCNFNTSKRVRGKYVLDIGIIFLWDVCMHVAKNLKRTVLYRNFKRVIIGTIYRYTGEIHG